MQATVALAGNPNSGKTTLFNELTGARQHVGNYPGVTVEKKEGTYTHKDFKLHIVDLPGTYSLTAYSLEEVVARDYLVNEKPEVVINIVDSSNLERNLYLAVQFLEMGIPVCIALNMIDVAKKRGIEINAEKLSTLLGVPVIPTIARTGQGKIELMESAAQIVQERRNFAALKISYGDDVDRAMLDMEEEIAINGFLTDIYPVRWIALKYMEKDEQILSLGRKLNPGLSAMLEEIVKKVSNHLLNTLDTYPEAMIADQRYGYINSILKQGVIYQKYDPNRLYSSDKIDKVLTNRGAGFCAFDHVHVFRNRLSRGLRLSGPGCLYAGQDISHIRSARQLGDGLYRFRRHCRGLCGPGSDGHPDTKIPPGAHGNPVDRTLYELRGQAAGICPFDRGLFCKI